MNYLFFDGGPLGGMKVVTTAAAGREFYSNRAVYAKEKSWSFAGTAVVHCYRYVVGHCAADSAGGW